MLKTFITTADIIDELMTMNSLSSIITTPFHDVIEIDNEFIVEAILPGFKKEEICIEIDENKLRIEAIRKEDNDSKYNYRQSLSGKFVKTFKLPDISDIDNIVADLNNGILKIVIPKLLQNKSKKKIIEIK